MFHRSGGRGRGRGGTSRATVRVVRVCLIYLFGVYFIIYVMVYSCIYFIYLFID